MMDVNWEVWKSD